MVDKGHPPLPLNLQPGWDHERGAGSVHLGWYVEANRKVAVLSQEDSSGEGGTASHLEQPRLLAGFQSCT